MKSAYTRTDWSLFFLRAWFSTSLFLKHGWEKPTSFAAMAEHFPDPIHIGPVPSLAFALLADAVCSILILIGLGTRWAAGLVLVNLLVAWALVHHYQYFGHGADHGEVMVLYMGGFIAIALLGPGRFSVDDRVRKTKPRKR